MILCKNESEQFYERLYEEYIHLKKQFQAQDKDSSSVLALYEFADRLALLETPEAKQVLVDVYQELGLYASAFSFFLELVDKSDRKQVKKLFTLEKMNHSHGDRFALPRPLTDPVTPNEFSRKLRSK